MTIYGIYCDNGMQYEDHDYSLEHQHIYSSREVADKICEQLNNPIFTPPTQEEYKEQHENGFMGSYEDYSEYCHDQQFNPYYTNTYTVVQLEVKT